MKKIFLKTSTALLLAGILVASCNSVNRTSSGSDTTDRMGTPNDTSMYRNQEDTSGNSNGQTDTISPPRDTSRQ